MTNNLEIRKNPSRLTLHHMLRESTVPVSPLTFDSSSSSHKTHLVNHRRKDSTFETMTNKIARLLIWCATTPKIQLASITCFWPFPNTLDCNYAIESEMNCTPVNHCNINLNFLLPAERFVIHLKIFLTESSNFFFTLINDEGQEVKSEGFSCPHGTPGDVLIEIFPACFQ